ncbi:hypothetical protein [Lentibacillus saliphilus]|uniref:hypothetical protein n=1 Tax=Lentibacillus saliphilus TaxID=2737028 RepID=UPI001C2FE5F9|nr:hypothetical protein [Lentibacillus saliphilus]
MYLKAFNYTLMGVVGVFFFGSFLMESKAIYALGGTIILLAAIGAWLNTRVILKELADLKKEMKDC